MGPSIILLTLFGAFVLSEAKPLDSLLDAKDSELVDSKINKIYAPAPFEDLLMVGSEEERSGGSRSKGGQEADDGGFYASKSTKGDNGYKHFDSYHKKGGDKYGYEAHSSFGKTSGGKKGGSHQTSANYKSGGDDASHEEYYEGEGTANNYGRIERGRKDENDDHKGSATDGDYYYSNYESDGEGDQEHFSEEGDHYSEDDGGHHSEGYVDGESNEGYYDGEEGGESESYYDGEGETRQKTVVHHGGPTGGATSYSVRHY